MTSLEQLKAFVLPVKERSATTYDAALTVIGGLVQGAMEGYCAQRFERVVGAMEVFSARREMLVLGRPPIEVVSAIDYRATAADTWAALGASYQVLEEAGVVELEGVVRGGQVRVTYTGGYWWDASVEQEGTLPEGARALPADLKGAYLVQCQAVWEKRDNVGGWSLSRQKEGVAVPSIGTVELVPVVKGILGQYRRVAG